MNLTTPMAKDLGVVRIQLFKSPHMDLFEKNAILMTEKFTEIRKDIRVKNQSTQADVDLLFREVEGLKRQTNKIEKRLSNQITHTKTVLKEAYHFFQDCFSLCFLIKIFDRN